MDIKPVKNKRDYQNALDRIEKLMDSPAGAAGMISEDIELSLQSGYLRLPGKVNDSDSCEMIPVAVRAGYMAAAFLDVFYITPFSSAGIDFIFFKHKSGNGFDMKENSGRTGVDPAFSMDMDFGAALSEHIHLTAGAEFRFLYEREEIVRYFAAGIGVRYCLAQPD